MLHHVELYVRDLERSIAFWTHLAFRAKSRAHVDKVRAWARDAGHPLLYDARYPFATAPGYYAVFCEDPDRIKVEVVAPV